VEHIPSDDNLLTVKQVAELLGIAPKTLRNRLGRGDGSAPVAVKTSNGYNIRFERSAIADWIKANRTK